MSNSNPYYEQDLQTICNAYTTPGVGGPVEDLSALQAFREMSGYAAAEAALQRHIDEATGWLEGLQQYGTASTSTTGNVLGVDVQNTLITMLGEDPGDAIKTMVVDCVPCIDRVTAILSLNPLTAMWDLLEENYNRMAGFIDKLWNLLAGIGSVNVWADLCSLIQFFNFMCVTDVVRIIAALSALIAKYTAALRDTNISFQSLLGMMVGPTLGPLISLLDRYKQLVVDVLSCILNSLNMQIEKLDIVRPAGTGAYEVRKPGSAQGTLPRFATAETAEAVGGALKSLYSNIEEAEAMLQDETNKWMDAAEKFLGQEDKTDSSTIDITQKLTEIARMVALAKAILKALMASKKSTFSCESEEALKGFIDTYVAPNADVGIKVEDGKIIITSKLPQDIKDILGPIASFQRTYSGGTEDTSAGDGSIILGEAVIPVSNCLYKSTASELQKVRETLNNFGES